MIKKISLPILLIAISVLAIFFHICIIFQNVEQLSEWKDFIGLQTVERSEMDTLKKIAPREIFILTHINISHVLYIFVDCILIVGAIFSLIYLIRNIFYKKILMILILLLTIAIVLFVNFSILFYTYSYGIRRFFMGAADLNLSLTYLCFALFCCFLIIIAIILLIKSKKYITRYKNKEQASE